MAALSVRDYRGVLDVLHAAAASDGPDPFPQSVLEALRTLVPCDVVAYHEQYEPATPPVILFSGEPKARLTPEIRASHRRFRGQDPLPPANGARKVADVLSRREYHRLELYQYVDRPLGIEYLMRLWIDPRGVAGARLEFDRASRDFSERDRAVLDVLLPHLRQLRHAAVCRRRSLRPWPAGAHVSAREREVIAHVSDGRTNAEIGWALGISAATVRKHLENAYAKLGVGTRTGAVRALSQSTAPPPSPGTPPPDSRATRGSARHSGSCGGRGRRRGA